MDVMRTGCSILGNVEPEVDFSGQHDVADRLLVDAAVDHQLLVSLQPRRRANRNGNRRRFTGRTFPVHAAADKRPSELQQRVMDVSLILYAEHEFNASTFTARVCASTLSDMHSCVTGAIGSLRGPLHGGANEAAMEMIEKFDSPADGADGNQGHAGAQGQNHGIRSRDLRNVRPAQRDHQENGRRSSRKTLATKFCTRSRSLSKRRCGTRRSCSPTPTSITRPRITSWASPRSCLRRFSFVRAYRDGPRTSWNSVPTTASFGRARTMSVRRRAPSLNCQIVNRRKQNMSANVDLNVRPDPGQANWSISPTM